MRLDSTGYTIGFAGAVCLVCSVFVAGAAVALKDKQEANKLLDKQKKVLSVSGLVEDGNNNGSVDDEVGDLEIPTIQGYFTDGTIQADMVAMNADADCSGEDPAVYDMRKRAKDPATSFSPDENGAKVNTMANCAVVYQVTTTDGAKRVILPIQGPGLWSTLYGFIAVADDGDTVQGIVFYEHGETPGLGGEVDNPSWRAGWVGRKVYENGEVAISVKKGKAGDAASDPHQVDGLSGATITGNGVTKTVEFWLGDQGFGPYLKSL